MRVLMINRRDAFTVPGGDTVQMVETKNALRDLDVQVDVCLLGDKYPEEVYDVIHVFNWEQLGLYIRSSKPPNIEKTPIVLSTIFWFYTGHWFDTSVSKGSVWRLIQKAVGASRARNIYERWQQTKFSYGGQSRQMRKDFLHVKQFLPNSEIEWNHLENVLKIHGQSNLDSTIVPNGIIKDLYEPLPAPNADFCREFRLEGFILQVARIQSAKNQKGLIEALFDMPVPIVFVGQPSPYEVAYVNECYALAKKRGKVFFIPPKTSAELAGIYRLAAVHVLPSWRETPGLVSLEAAAAGCKVVSTNQGSAQEYFREQAWYCNPRDNASIRQAVAAALAAPTSSSLRNRVLERFTWEAAAQKTLQAYRKAVANLVVN